MFLFNATFSINRLLTQATGVGALLALPLVAGAAGPTLLGKGIGLATTSHARQAGRVPATAARVPGKGRAATQPTAVAPAAAAMLSNLVPSVGVLSPAFISGTTSYTLTVPVAPARITLTPTTTDATATIVINGMTVASGTPSGGIVVPNGPSTITVTVTDLANTTTETYTIAVQVTCALEAVAQNVRVVLGPTGAATVTGAQVGGTTSTSCGPVSYTIQRIVRGNVGEHLVLDMAAPTGRLFTSVPFASYGTPIINANGTYTIQGCHATAAQQVAEAALLQHNSASFLAENSDFTDPCPGTQKTLAIIAAYSADAPQHVFTCDDLGTSTVLLTATDAQGNRSQATATVTVSDELAPIAQARNVTVPLGPDATATPTVAQVNNGSSDNCTVQVELLAGVENVANGTFDSNASGWTPANVTAGGGYQSVGGDGLFVLQGAGGLLTDPTITQAVSGLTVGATYVVRGRYRSYTGSAGAGAPAFGVDIDGSQIAAFPDRGTAWMPFVARFVATTPRQTLGLRGEIGGTALDIAVDDISLRQLNPSYTCANVGPNAVLLLATDASGNQATALATVTVTMPTLSTTTWTGRVGTDWNDCRNWSYGQVPSATISAVLPGNVANAPVVGVGTARMYNVSIGGSMGVDLGIGGRTMQVYGNWLDTSTASTLAGTVAFVGTAPQTISQPSGTPFGTLIVNKASGTLALNQDIEVRDALALTSGVLATGSHQVQLGSLATIAETEASYVTGTVATSRTIAGIAESFGGLGLVLTPAAGSVAPGLTSVVRTTGTALSGVGPGASIQRYFDIQPATNTGLDMAMAFQYFDHELNTIGKANLTLYKSTTTTSGPWLDMQGTNDAANNQVTQTGLTDFSVWTLGSVTNPLPVVLLDFVAQPQGAAVQLAWHTASEKNSARFDIERSLDGRTFRQLGAVAAQGTTSRTHSYSFRDAQLPGGTATLYYRLRQVDVDGTYTFSPVRVVGVARAGTLALFPNPTTATATLSGAPAQVAVQVLDALGRTVYTTTTTADGSATLDLPAGLPKGIYIVRAGTQAARLTVE
jgi:hypothetical protein